jgi:sugar/nucleoside kinase (ribokinase family)
VLHRVASAMAASAGRIDMVDGPYTDKPLITTGAGDHFNAGFVLGKLLGLENAASLLSGVSASGYYVRTGKSPVIGDIVNLLRNWPT